MILKTWSGKISINDVEVEVNVVLTSDQSGMKEWHGNGSFSFDKYPKLHEVIMNRKECETKIGDLFLTNLSTNGTFTFQGTGKELF